jgi:NAD dependent epimerase/dehydratase
MTKVLVTGADGFIGSHLTEALVAQGHAVKCFVFYNSFNSWGWLDHVAKDVRDSIEVFAGDIRDPHGVREAMKGCDAVLHLAALIGIPFSYHSPDAYLDTNVRGTLNVVQAARDLGVSKVVHTSTSEVYGTAQFVPITEEHPLVGQSPYAATKIGADQMALSFHRSFATPVAVLRPFNTYGARQSARAVIPATAIQILGGKKKIRLGALTPTRDFSYVKDTAAAFIAVMKAEGAVGQVLNAASNFEISIGKTVEIIAETLGTAVTVEEDPNRIRPAQSEVERLWGDAGRLKDLTGWSPAYGGEDGFRRGIAETLDWLRQPENLARFKSDIYNI